MPLPSWFPVICLADRDILFPMAHGPCPCPRPSTSPECPHVKPIRSLNHALLSSGQAMVCSTSSKGHPSVCSPHPWPALSTRSSYLFGSYARLPLNLFQTGGSDLGHIGLHSLSASPPPSLLSSWFNNCQWLLPQDTPPSNKHKRLLSAYFFRLMCLISTPSYTCSSVLFNLLLSLPLPSLLPGLLSAAHIVDLQHSICHRLQDPAG